MSDGLIDVTTEELNQAIGTLPAQTQVVIVRTFGRSGSLNKYLAQNKIVILEPRHQAVVIQRDKGIVSRELGSVYLESHTSRNHIEQRIADNQRF